MMRVEDRGESESWAVMAQIRVETSPDAKVGRLPLGLPSQENLAKRLSRRADDGESWCTLGYDTGMGWSQLANHIGKYLPTPNAYCEGSEGRQMEQGKSLATSADSFGRSQNAGCSPNN